jgi:hypothetical protein
MDRALTVAQRRLRPIMGTRTDIRILTMRMLILTGDLHSPSTMGRGSGGVDAGTDRRTMAAAGPYGVTPADMHLRVTEP